MNLFSAGVYKHFRSLSLAWNADSIRSSSIEEVLPISILMGLCKGNLWPKIILIMICLDIFQVSFLVYIMISAIAFILAFIYHSI